MATDQVVESKEHQSLVAARTYDDDYDVSDGLPQCQRCLRQIPVEDTASQKFAGARVVSCKARHNLATMLSKHIGMKGFQELLDQDAQVKFYQDCLSKSRDGPLNFKNVRSMLKEQMVVKVVNTTKHGNQGSYQPLGYWTQLGYDGDRIRELAPQKEHAILGTTYAVDTLLSELKVSARRSF